MRRSHKVRTTAPVDLTLEETAIYHDHSRKCPGTTPYRVVRIPNALDLFDPRDVDFLSHGGDIPGRCDTAVASIPDSRYFEGVCVGGKIGQWMRTDPTTQICPWEAKQPIATIGTRRLVCWDYG